MELQLFGLLLFVINSMVDFEMLGVGEIVEIIDIDWDILY